MTPSHLGGGVWHGGGGCSQVEAALSTTELPRISLAEALELTS